MDPKSPSSDRHDDVMEVLLEMPAVTSPGGGGLEGNELDDYLEQLDHALGLIATYARHEPELTLWCCRRVAELILRCLHLHYGATRIATRNPTLAQLRGHVLPGGLKLSEVLRDANVLNLNTVQGQGNIGVHARRNGRKEAWDGVGSAISALVSLVDRLFEADLLGPGLISESLQRNVDLVRQGGLQDLPAGHHIEQLQGEVRELVSERDELNARLAAAAARLKSECEVVAREAGRRVRADVEPELAPALGKLRRRAEAAEARVAELEAAPTVAETTPLRAVMPVVPMTEDESAVTAPLGDASSKPSLLWRLVRGLAAVLLLGGGITAALVGVGIWTIVDNWVPQVSTPAPTASPALSVAPSASTVSPARQVAAPGAVCSDSSILVPSSTFSLRPPTDRKDWPRPARSSARRVVVDSFCIDRRPVPQALAKGHEPCQGNPQTFEGQAPATCLSRYEADAWCEEHGGSLPTIVQWEAVARADALDELAWQLDREWVADAFPPAIFSMNHFTDPKYDALFRKRRLKRVEPDGVRWSWNRHDGDARWTHFGFRCAYPVDEG